MKLWRYERCLWLITLVILHSIISNAQDCIKDSTNRKCTSGSRTPYRYIANYNTSELNYEGCTAKKIWMLVRHGTRYPKGKRIHMLITNLPRLRDKIIEKYKSGDSKISKSMFESFCMWNTNFSVDLDVKLAPEGKIEMIELATRMKTRFPKLFPENYDMNLYDIHHTPTSRTQQSAEYFSLGLFGKETVRDIVFPMIRNKSIILRFYKQCERWQKEVKHNPATYHEKKKFFDGQIVKDLIKNVSDYLGFELQKEDIQLIYIMCAFETALYKSKNSPWCDVFSFDQLKILEYGEDLNYYWKDGYGYKLTYEQACPTLKDMFDFVQSDTDKLVTLYFTHSGTILKLLALMNVAKDQQPLTHETFSFHQNNRNWRVSLIDSFASNIAFVSYDCSNDGPSILTMHQERAIYLNGCPEYKPCPLKKMKELYVDNDEECPFDMMCSIYDKTEL